MRYKILVLFAPLFLTVSCDKTPKLTQFSKDIFGDFSYEILTTSRRIKINETLRLQIITTFPFDTQLKSFSLTENNSEITIKNKQLYEAEPITKNRQSQRICYEFYANSFGKQIIPSLELKFNNSQEIVTIPVSFEIMTPQVVPKQLNEVERAFNKSSHVSFFIILITAFLVPIVIILHRKNKNIDHSKRESISTILSTKITDKQKAISIYNFLLNSDEKSEFLPKLEKAIFAKETDKYLSKILQDLGESTL